MYENYSRGKSGNQGCAGKRVNLGWEVTCFEFCLGRERQERHNPARERTPLAIRPAVPLKGVKLGIPIF